ncbi:MAG: DUF859 family phage minor structural protein [Acutalibacteraceae bacterium]
MPTSQNFDTSNKYVKYRIEVNVNSQSIENNTSNITVKVWFFRTNQGYSTFGTGTCYCGINGTSYSQAVISSQKITSSPIALFTKTVDVPHDNDGSKSVWVSAYISHNAPLTSSDQGFSAGLPKIARAAQFTDADDFNDEQNPKIYFNNPAGFRLQLKMEAGGDDYLIVRDNLVDPNSPYTFELTEEERNKLRALCPNSNNLAVRFTVATYMPGSKSPGNHSYGDRTMTITNANPNFAASQLSYKDTNSNVVGVTNDDQLIVRNQSTLEASFTAATARKSASISKYQIIFNGNTQDKTSAGSYNLGTVDSSKNLSLEVKAIDSRGNSTVISNSVLILDWVLPVINLSAKRINNYEDDTKLKAKVEISSVKKLNKIEVLQYRTKKVSDSEWSSWINFQNNAETTVVLNKLFAWNLEIKAADKFGTVTQNLIVPKGIPIMFFDTKKLSVGVNMFPENSNTLETMNLTVHGETMIFEEGSWNPELSSRSGKNPAYSALYRHAHYKRFNNLCYVSFHGKWNITNAGTDYACVTGLPYVSNGGMNGQSLALHEMFGAISTNPTRCGVIPDNSSRIDLQGEHGSLSAQWQTGDVWVGFSGVYLIKT